MKSENMNKYSCLRTVKDYQVSSHEHHKLNRQFQVGITVHRTCTYYKMHGQNDGQLISNNLPVSN